VHHPLGDLKKAATSRQPLKKEKWKFSERTHLRVEWGANGGGTLDGSSGAGLVNKETNQVLGVLSGGVTAKNCSGNHDFFGSLEHAWERGLKDVLDLPEAPRPRFGFGIRTEIKRSMPGRDYFEKSNTSSDGQTFPELIITPPRLIISESSQPENVAQVALSEAPKNGEIVHVEVTLSQFPTPSRGPDFPAQPRLILLTDTIVFTPANWNSAQPVVMIPGDDTLAEWPLPFQLEFKLKLVKNEGTRGNTEPFMVQQQRARVVQGLRTDEELVPGYSLDDPVVISRDPDVGLNISGTGILEPQGGRNQEKGKLIKLNDPLSEQVDSMPLGSATYFNLTLSKEGVFDVKVCSEEMELQMAIYFNNTATW
jgi:hypothetical protein